MNIYNMVVGHCQSATLETIHRKNKKIALSINGGDSSYNNNSGSENSLRFGLSCQSH